MSVVEAVQADLERLNNPELAKSSYGALALSLAAEMDSPNSATSKSMCARALLDTMNRLRELASEQTGEVSPLDEIRARRDAKLAGTSAAKDRTRAGRGRAS